MAGSSVGEGGIYNTVNLHVYHYAGNNPVKYTDPDGRDIDLSSRIEIKNEVSGIDWGEIGQRTLGLFVTGVGLLLDHVAPPLLTGLATVASGGSGAVATPLITGACKALGKTLQVAGAAIYFSAGSELPKPNYNNQKSSRNKPEERGEPNSTKVERNPDGSVRRVTQYDRNGFIKKEIRPTPSHGRKGPTVKEPVFNTNPETGETYYGYKVRDALPDEIELLELK